jgi:phosphoglucomutase
MALILHPESALPIGDPDLKPEFPGASTLDKARLDKTIAGMILSASGWRGIFAADGDEESAGPDISPAHRVIAAAAAKVYADYLKKITDRPGVILGMDTRPTGPAIADLMIRVFLAEGCAVRFAFITAAPEIMAYARSFAASADTGNSANTASAVKPSAFVFISASHNPIGHNGLKFGLTDGGVLPGAEAKVLTDAFRALVSAPDVPGVPNIIDRLHSLVNQPSPEAMADVYTAAPQIKRDACAAYLGFTREVVTGIGGTSAEKTAAQEKFLAFVQQGLAEYPLGIAADLNGSARTLSIDEGFLGGLGVRYRRINHQPRQIAHRIVPEGESLEPCRLFLEEAHREDPAFVLGYVPDCDGDRGNLVIWDDGRARSLEAQEVFALACIAELAHLVWTGELAYDKNGNALTKVAIAVNDPTSMRIDRIAHAFDVSVFRAEVGEANVVGLARTLRERGYTVRILGEGSAGGNITHPSAVRDPIDTVMALIKLLTIRSTNIGGEERKGLFELWCDLSDRTEVYRPDFTLSDIIVTLPAFISTGAYSPEALLTVRTTDHGLLKNRYQTVFLREWETRKAYLAGHYNITGWEAAAYQGVEEKRGIARFGDAGRGGLRIIFTNKAGLGIAGIWMRGSATEPVFRVMADAEGSDKRLERDLIEWQRRMVTEADGQA